MMPAVNTGKPDSSSGETRGRREDLFLERTPPNELLGGSGCSLELLKTFGKQVLVRP